MKPKPVICLATNNPAKVEEITEILGKRFTFQTLREIGCNEELPETGDTLEKNSLQKALYVFERYGLNSLADDSGLEVAALNGLPGVDSAHFSGSRDHKANIAKVLKMMKGIENRAARFRTVISLILDGQTHVFEGIAEGELLCEPVGSNGFGYDSVFKPLGIECSFAQLPSHEKNRISHRAKALQKLIAFCHEG